MKRYTCVRDTEQSSEMTTPAFDGSALGMVMEVLMFKDKLTSCPVDAEHYTNTLIQ